MQPILVGCNKCGARLKLPGTLPAGKKVKCPKCGEVLTLPQAAASDSDPGYRIAESPAAAASPVALAPATKRCPYCGEQILADAMKCRHCGEFLEGAAPARRKKAVASSDRELAPAEYIVATIFCPVGLVIGILWATKKLAKAKMMIQASGLSCVIICVCSLLAWFYYFKNRESANVVNMRPFIFIPSPDSSDGFGSPFNPEPSPQRGPEMPQGEVDLAGQPAEIQRAMRANVRIELALAELGGQAQGSGVVVDRTGEAALILTNRHVVDLPFALNRGATPLDKLPYPKISYLNKQSHPGTVVWLPPDDVDLALVKAPCPAEIEPVVWKTMPKVIVGDQVFAIGNPATLGWTFTRGTVSQMRTQKYGSREVPIIQTDTSISPGSSGGGLYNAAGELIGINSTIVNPNIAKGLGFAIRLEVLRELRPDVLQLPPFSTEPAAAGKQDGTPVDPK